MFVQCSLTCSFRIALCCRHVILYTCWSANSTASELLTTLWPTEMCVYVIITARCELRKVVFLAPSCSLWVFFCLCMKYLGNRWTDLRQIHREDVFGPSLGRTSLKVKVKGAKFTLRRSLALAYIGSVTARHSCSGRQQNCGVEPRAPPLFGRAAITLGIGPHSSCYYYFLG